METIFTADEEKTFRSSRMRQVTYIDKLGYKKVALLRDTDPDDHAEMGVPVGPPDFELVDWEEVKRELNNLLVDRCILTYADIQRNPSAVSSCVRGCLTSKIVNIYKYVEGTQ